jgi:REP element-mobilizing transposase RayT
LGEVIEEAVRLSQIGEIIRSCWLHLPDNFPVELDAWVIMPDHLHGILFLRGKGEAFGGKVTGKSGTPIPNASPLRPHGTVPASLGAIVQNFKSVTTRKINQLHSAPGGQMWQRNYYEHIVRYEADLERIRRYIAGNPLCWSQGFRDP